MSPSEGAVIITGGARGMGAWITRRVAGSGRPVAVLYRTAAEAARQLVDDIEAGGGRAIAIAADVGVEAEIEAAFDTVVETFGRVSALVNNELCASDPKKFVDWSTAEVDKVFRTNVVGAFVSFRAAVSRMSTRHGGSGGAIVSILSVDGLQTGALNGWVPVAASQSALEMLSLRLAREVSADGIRVNIVRAQTIETESHWSQGEDYAYRPIDWVVPEQHIGTPEDVADAVLWFLSTEASYATGGTLTVAGGVSPELS